ncbi:hypothetical protein AB0I54_43660 [Streptomyces sp. NPDC050625]
MRGVFENCILDGAPALVSEDVYRECLAHRQRIPPPLPHEGSMDKL